MAEKPTVFIGSSREGLRIAEALRHKLHDHAFVIVWQDLVFAPAESTLQSLVKVSRTCDFAVLVVTADDVLTSRDVVSLVPRDNVMFELGLFMGVLGAERTFMLSSEDEKVKLPTDLAGVTRAEFRSADLNKNVSAAVGAAAFEISETIRQLGAKDRSDGKATASEQQASNDRKLVSPHSDDAFGRVRDLTLRSHIIQIQELHLVLGQLNLSALANPILGSLESYYMRGYERALEQVCYADRLPLPSEPRMQVAIAALSAAKISVDAVQVVATDRWFTGEDRSVYRDANVSAMKRGVVVRRIAVLQDELADRETLVSVADALPATELRWLSQSVVEEHVYATIGKPFSVVNVLICDDNVMTISTNAPRHDGALVLNAREIAQHRETFDAMWEVAQLI